MLKSWGHTKAEVGHYLRLMHTTLQAALGMPEDKATAAGNGNGSGPATAGGSSSSTAIKPRQPGSAAERGPKAGFAAAAAAVKVGLKMQAGMLPKSNAAVASARRAGGRGSSAAAAGSGGADGGNTGSDDQVEPSLAVQMEVSC